MPCTRTLHGIALRCCAVLVACHVLDAVPVASQPFITAPPQSVRWLPWPTGLPNPEVIQVTRDGRRVLIRASSGVPRFRDISVVVDVVTAAVLFDSRSLEQTAGSYSDAVLTPDGTRLIHRTWTEPLVVWARDILDGTDVRLFTASKPFRLHAATDGATLTAYTTDAGLAVAGPVHAERLIWEASPDTLTTVESARFSADGGRLTFVHVRQVITGPSFTPVTVDVRPVVVDLQTGQAWRGDETAIPPPGVDRWYGPFPDAVGNRIGMSAVSLGASGFTFQGVLWTPARAVVRRLPHLTQFSSVRGMSEDGRHVLLMEGTPGDAYVLDSVAHLFTPMGMAGGTPPSGRTIAHLSGDGRTVVLQTTRGDLVYPEVPGDEPKMYVIGLDGDGDGLDDGWETTFGLDPASAADAALDPDGDGRTSAQEYADGTHPRGVPVRYFAEGANGAFFATSLALFNPTDSAVTANVRFLGADGERAAMPVSVPPQGPAYVEADDANLPFTEFSIVVESPVPLVAERRMTWDRTRSYGSHSSNGVAAPSGTWHFAEGATIAGLQTFFLLQNPGATPATVHMRYLLANGTTELRPHVIPPASRLTVWANQEGGPLGAAEFSTIVEADVPIVAERAMYRDAPGEIFAAGSAAAGAPSPGWSFLFAEGATGPFFDTYLLIANPGDAPASVIARYGPQPSTAMRIERTYVVAARSRRTIWVAREAPELRNTAVSAELSSDVPIVAERTMWWPGPTADTWRGTHAEVGAGRGAFTWVAADLIVADEPLSADAFLLVYTLGVTYWDNPQVLVSLSCADGTRTVRAFSLPWTGQQGTRWTLWLRQEFPEVVGRRCAATVESLPVDHLESVPPHVVRYPAYIVVESAVYGDSFSSGTASLATPLAPQWP